MSKHSVEHATFTIERRFDFAPSLVFAAFSARDAKAKWFVGPEGWEKSNHKLDFRVGGTESVSGGPPGGVVHRYDATIQDIVTNERIVTTYTMHMDDVKTSVSVATLEFKPSGKGTVLTLTEQGAFLDGFDNAAERERGTKELLDNLEAALKRAAAN